MTTYLDPQLTIMQAAPVLEQELRQRYGEVEYQRLYRSVALRSAELTTTEEAQFFGMVILLGKTQDQVSQALALIWFAQHVFRDPLVRQYAEGVQSTMIGTFLTRAREAVSAAERALEEKGD